VKEYPGHRFLHVPTSSGYWLAFEHDPAQYPVELRVSSFLKVLGQYLQTLQVETRPTPAPIHRQLQDYHESELLSEKDELDVEETKDNEASFEVASLSVACSDPPCEEAEAVPPKRRRSFLAETNKCLDTPLEIQRKQILGIVHDIVEEKRVPSKSVYHKLKGDDMEF
jgi:hypothetical protein